jgi:hypothetical protein
MPTSNQTLYRSAKISDHTFRQVLGHFVRDHTAAETARQTGLSHNSIHAIFHKLRVYFTQTGLFLDIYAGQELDKFDIGDPAFERLLLDYHFTRIRSKRGVRCPPNSSVDYHFAESYWRLGFKKMREQRPSEQIYSMMENNLVEIIRICGAVGGKPVNFEAGMEAVFHQIDKHLLWLKRSAPNYSAPHLREQIDDVLAVQLDKRHSPNSTKIKPKIKLPRSSKDASKVHKQQQ